MEFTDLIKTRESVRSYDPDRPVPVDILEKILEAGRLAPSAANRQPWKFIVISSPAMLQKVKACYDRDWFGDAPQVLAVAGLRDQAWSRRYDGYSSLETDAAIAMTHIILAAENEGAGTCWIAAFDPEKLRKALDTGPEEIIFGITPLGYPKPGFKKINIKQRKPLSEITRFL